MDLKDLFSGTVNQTTPAKVIEKGGKKHMSYLVHYFRALKRLFVFAYVIVVDAVNNKAGIKTVEGIFFQKE